jgi:hypothetical protein
VAWLLVWDFRILVEVKVLGFIPCAGETCPNAKQGRFA